MIQALPQHPRVLFSLNNYALAPVINSPNALVLVLCLPILLHVFLK